MLKIIVAAIFTAQTCLAGTTNSSQSKFTPPNALGIAVAYNNLSVDGESLFNILSDVSGKPQEVDELKKHLGPQILKKPTLKFKRVDGNTYSSGKNTISLNSGKIRVNGKDFAYDSSKTMLLNYKKFQADFGAKKKTSLFEYLIPQAIAQEGYGDNDGSPVVWLFGLAAAAAALVGLSGGGGGGAFVIGALGAGASLAAGGAGAMFYSGDLSADEAYTTTGLCQKKGNTFTNTTFHISGDTSTQELEAKDGQLIVTYKQNGETIQTFTIVKKGESHEVSKLVVNGKSVDPTADQKGKLGNYFTELYKACANPTKEQADFIARVNQVGRDIKAGKIQVATKTKTESKPAAEKAAAQ